MSVDEEELRRQFEAAFGDADYPVEEPMDLAGTVSLTTRFEAGDFSTTAMGLQGMIDEEQAAFPYEDVDALVDDLMDALRENGHI